MLYNLIVWIVVCMLIWMYQRWLRIKNYWLERNVPYLPPNPIYGSLSFLQQENVGIWLRKMYNRFKTPYVGIWLFWRPALIVNSPEIARRVLVKDFGHFRDRYLSCGDTDPIGKYNLFATKDPDWTKLRRRLNGTFTAARLRYLQDYICSKSKELAQRIQREQRSRIALRTLYVDYTTDAIGTSAFGVVCNSTLTGKDPLRSITEDFMQYNYIRGLAWCSIFFFPDLVDIFRFKFFPKPTTDYFRKIFRIVAAQREANGSDFEKPKDLLDSLLKFRKESVANNEGFPDDAVISIAAIFLFGGFDSSAGVLSFATYELAFNPVAQEKLYQELLEAKTENGSDNFTAEKLGELTYLNCVIKEALRKHTSMGWIDRIAVSDYEIDEKLTIKSGTPVYINSTGMHYDPNYFPDPKKFDPDRFLPENEKNIKPYTYMPFGSGPRSCIGQRFGVMTMRYALLSVFLNYKVRPFPNSPKPADVAIEKHGIFHSPGEPICVEFIPRE